VEYPENEYGYSSCSWYHPDCLKNAMPSLNMKKLDPEEFSGFTGLRSLDKTKLRKTFGAANEESSDTSKDKGFVILNENAS